jgi:hypothetical protein
MKKFRQELEEVINKHSMENGSDTPDFILAEYLTMCLRAFDVATKKRNNWYNKPMSDKEKREIIKNNITDTTKFGHTNFMNVVNERFSEKPHAITFEEAEKMANDINYHNKCARATLGDLPEVKPEDLMKDLNNQIDASKVIEIEPITVKEGTSKPKRRNPNTL